MSKKEKTNFNPFNQPNPMVQERDKKKFTPKAPKFIAKLENASTPWSCFKTQILEKQREEQNANSLDMESSDAREALKKREQNYRRQMISEKSKELTKWETFSENSANKSQSIFKKHKNRLITDSLKNNFDSRNLNFQQNNHIRKILTKGILNSKETRLRTKHKRTKEKKVK